MDGPDQIGPDYRPKRTWGDVGRRFVKTFTTRLVMEARYTSRCANTS